MASTDKFTRWVDLIAALLVRNAPATFNELAKEVPEYAAKLLEIEGATGARKNTLKESLKTKFERDKAELKAFGVQIESVADEDGNAAGAYRLFRRNFYLPYLCVARPSEPTPAIDRVDKYGYQALTTLRFEPDELQAVVDAALLVRTLGDPVLASDATNALRKLAVDLPVDASAAGRSAEPGTPHLVLPRARASNDTFDGLSDALQRRKRVTMQYHTQSTDTHSTRTVEPYGLFFLNGHWYLVARDTAIDELRNFRLNRITDVDVNSLNPQSTDYDIPPTFRLRDHAASRQAWELGDDDVTEVIAAFTAETIDDVTLASLGRPVVGEPNRRAFAVRRLDPFVRWTLSFAGDMRIEEPSAVRDAVRMAAERTLDLYERAAPPIVETAHQRPAPLVPATGEYTWKATGAAAQLQRILNVVPQLADDAEHPIAEVAATIGSDVKTVVRDLKSLVERYDLPGGFNEGVRVFVENGRVSAMSNHFLRPMRLTTHELCALELGLAMLMHQRAPNEHRVLEGARQRLRETLAKLPGDRVPESSMVASVAALGSSDTFSVIRDGIVTQHQVHLAYRKAGSAVIDERDVCPYEFVAASGMMYLAAYCLREADDRVFRMDRVQGATLRDETFERRPDFNVDELLTEGRVFHGEAPETLVVRYSPRIARWIAEREGLAVAEDGSLTTLMPLADTEWALRFVLQYGADAEALAPIHLRTALSARLRRMVE